MAASDDAARYEAATVDGAAVRLEAAAVSVVYL
jgi:hypothetical protein